MTAKVTIGGRTQPTDEVRARALKAATGLMALGVTRGDVVALLLRNDFAFVEATLAAGMLGAYTTPLNWHGTPAEIAYLLRDSDAKVLVAHQDLLPAVRGVVPAGVAVFAVEPSAALIADYRLGSSEPGREVLWSDWLEQHPPRVEPPLVAPGAMVYTSGTTGRPKGVRRDPPSETQASSALAMFLTLTGTRDWLDRIDEVTAVIPGPLYHSAPNAWLTALVGLGASVVVETRFEPERLLATVAHHRATHALLVPTMFVRLLRLPAETRDAYDTSSLRFVMHGAAPCPVAVKQAMIDWLGPVIHEHYGGTELGALTYCDTEQWLAHPGSVGAPIDGVQLLIFGEEGRPVAQGAAGEVYCRNFGFPDFTYHNDSGKRSAVERDGLISLGDVGYLDADGFLYLCGRATEMVNSGGVNIYPAEIEAELLKMPEVADCAVFGVPDEEFGERLCAYVQPRVGAVLKADSVEAFLRERLAAYKVPRHVQIEAGLPREDSGKIFKQRLRERHLAGA